MSLSDDKNDGFSLPKFAGDSNTKLEYMRFNEKSCRSLTITAVFAVNYVATIRGKTYDLDKTEKMVWDKKLESFEKKHHPVYLKFVIKENSLVAEMVLQRMNSKTETSISVSSVKIDSKSVRYFYLGSKDLLNSDKHRILIFSVIDKSILSEIRSTMSQFGTKADMHQRGYHLPEDLSVVVSHVYLHCVPRQGCYVSQMKKKMSSPLEKIFSKKGSIAKISKRYDQINTTSYFRRSENCESVKNDNRDFKSPSIESLLLANDDLSKGDVFLSIGQRYTSNTDLPNSLSTHSSTNGELNDPDSPMCCKFENLVHNERGLRHFKDFLNKEISSENILFWEAIQDFSTIQNQDLMKTKAAEIFNTYIDAKCDTPVNLECDVVEQARLLLNNPHRDMFNAAKTHIFYLMKTDSYNRFRKSIYFDLWQHEYRSSSGMKHASSTSSLCRVKKRRTFLPNIFGKKDKEKKEDSPKSSMTLDSDCSSSNQSSSCKITLLFELKETHNVKIEKNKKLITVLKKIHKPFQENEAVAFDESNHKIVPFQESMANMAGRQITVEQAIVIRIGFVQINMDINLYEYVWFVIRPRSHLCLSNALDPVAKRMNVDLSNCVVIKEEDPYQIEWDTPIYLLNKYSLLIIDQDVFRKAKFHGKSGNNNMEVLWKKIMNTDSFLATLPFDDENIIDSRHDVFSKYKLEPRKVGYIINASVLQRSGSELTGTRSNSYSYDDQRGMCTDHQLAMPDFLKTFHRTGSDESSSLGSKRLSEIIYSDIDLSFSEIDEFSDHSPSKLELISDLE